MTQRELLKRLFGRKDEEVKPLPRATVNHDSVDKMRFSLYASDSPRFRHVAVDDAPQIAPDVPDPEPIDFTEASPEEIAEWQGKARAAKAARDTTPPYNAWEDLTRDIFYAYHHHREPEVRPTEEVDPSVAHHSKIVERTVVEDSFARARNITKNDPIASGMALLAYAETIREALTEQLIEQARQSQEVQEQIDNANGLSEKLESLREDAQTHQDIGQPVPRELIEQIKQAIRDKRQAQAQAAQTASQVPIQMNQAGAEAIKAATAAAEEGAKKASLIPGFSQGFGEGEPRYESPEQALTIADMWINNPTLRAIAELFGRLDQDMRFQRAKRVVGGEDEIVDLTLGDEIRRILPSELGALADPDLEDDFYMRFLGGELRVYETVGEENAGRGPIVIVVDESSSMQGQPNVWAKALALALLNIARREKRDFAYVAFSSGRQVHSYEFPAKKALEPQQIVDMASHFYGGGTTPVIGLAAADKIMEDRDFRKADVVMVSDGEAGFGDEDKRLRNRMAERGVRFHGIGIGGPFRYLEALTEDVVDIHDFELEDPSAATAHLATHVT